MHAVTVLTGHNDQQLPKRGTQQQGHHYCSGDSSNSNSSINSNNSINRSNSNTSSSKATATTAATARLRGGWRGAGRMGGQKGGSQCNNTQQSNNIVQHPILDNNVPQCNDLNKLVLALLASNHLSCK